MKFPQKRLRSKPGKVTLAKRKSERLGSHANALHVMKNLEFIRNGGSTNGQKVWFFCHVFNT